LRAVGPTCGLRAQSHLEFPVAHAKPLSFPEFAEGAAIAMRIVP
jgi:hypothetical protein